MFVSGGGCVVILLDKPALRRHYTVAARHPPGAILVTSRAADRGCPAHSDELDVLAERPSSSC